MHLLVLSDRPGGGRALLPSLEYLDHTVQDVGLEAGLMQALGSCDLVLVDGTSVGAVTSYMFTNVTANHTISVSFTPSAYTVMHQLAWELIPSLEGVFADLLPRREAQGE